jgi:hypothetical protein
MQTVNLTGIYGQITKYNQEELETLLKRKDISHVEVFDGTEENIKERQGWIGKTKLGVKKRYQKAPKNKKR